MESAAANMKLIRIPAGEFWMGPSANDKMAHNGPERQIGPIQVKSFYLGICEVTVAEYKAVMGDGSTGAVSHFHKGISDNKGGVIYVPDKPIDDWNREAEGNANIRTKDDHPVMIKGDDLPVTRIELPGAEDFCKKLNDKVRGNRVYRLPTETEWEYACRGETKGGRESAKYGSRAKDSVPYGNDKLDYRVAVFKWKNPDPDANPADARGTKALEDTVDHPLPVGSRLPNIFGLYDMHGNVWEITKSMDNSAPFVYRGGSFRDDAYCCRASARVTKKGSASTSMMGGSSEIGTIGFRIAMDEKEP